MALGFSFVFMLLGVVFFVLTIRKAKKTAQLEDVRNHIARDLHDDIGATLTSISFYTQAALAKLKNEKADDAQKIIQQTGISAREAIGNMNDIVWFINPNNDKLRTLFVRIEDHALRVFAERGIAFFLYYKDEDLDNTLNMEQRKNLYLICKEAITNAAKYANCKNVEILVEKRNVIIKDDGIGFDHTMQPLGNGLLNMKVRAHQLGAVFSIHSADKMGTTIKIGFANPHNG